MLRIALLLLLPAAVLAGTPKSEVDALAPAGGTGAGWRFRAAPYLWLTSVSGSVGAGPLSADANLRASDALSQLTFGFMLLTEVGYERWSLENDAIFARFRSGKDTPGPLFGELNSTLNQFQWTSLLGYRALETDRFTFDLQAGFRMISLGINLELTPGLLQGRSRYFSRTWMDPVIGFRSRTQVLDWLFIALRGDIGGFGANSELTWQAFAGAGAQISSWAAFVLGYRAIGYDYDQAGFTYDLTTYGPVAGFELSF